MKFPVLWTTLFSLALVACGGGSGSGGTSPQQPGGQQPGLQPPGAQQPGPQSFPVTQNGTIPASLEVTMTCGTSQSNFGLGLFSGGTARVLSDGVVTDGRYSISTNKLQIQLSSGINAESTSHLIFAGILAGMNLSDNTGNQYPCVTRTHTQGERFSQSEAFRCGRLNIGGEAADTFNLYADGSSDWVNVYELPGGVDTTFRTRVGTYIYDSASGRLGMIYKGIDSDDVFAFEAQVSGVNVKMVAAPQSGDGADTPNKSCAAL